MIGNKGSARLVTDRMISDLADIVGSDQVITDVDVVKPYESDWTGRFIGSTPLVVRPGTAAEVSEVLTVCSRLGIPVVPQGGNTGLVGGGVPLAGEVVLHLARLKQLDPVDSDAAQVTAGAGVTIGELQRHVAASGLIYPIDLGSRDSATVGGTIATNAGGIHVIRWGDTRRQVVGIEAVLSDGTRIEHLGGLIKDNTGYNLASLLCGSEGTLAVVTAARLRLVPKPTQRASALIALESVVAAVKLAGHLRSTTSEIDAIELILGESLELVCSLEGLPQPFRCNWPVYLLIEVSGKGDLVTELASSLADFEYLRDAAIVDDERGRSSLWSYRERISMAINRVGTPHKLDITVPVMHIAEFTEMVKLRVHEVFPEAHVWLFGHVGDGNIHVNITGVDPKDEKVDELVFEYVASLGGSISAEHGIGTAKKQWLHLCRSSREIEVFARLKEALDPAGILNPQVLLP